MVARIVRTTPTEKGMKELEILVDSAVAHCAEDTYLLRWFGNPQPVVIAHFMGASFQVRMVTVGYA